jgi:ABC-type transport system involved in cytochrome bd biosynthesis fused ATPase/permease subunit
MSKLTSTLLADAATTIAGVREQEYGSKLQNFTQIAMLFQGTLATKLLPNARITPEDVALLMMQVKIARLAKSPDHKDSILDVAGYAGCYDDLQLQRVSGVALAGATVDPRSV